MRFERFVTCSRSRCPMQRWNLLPTTIPEQIHQRFATCWSEEQHWVDRSHDVARRLQYRHSPLRWYSRSTMAAPRDRYKPRPPWPSLGSFETCSRSRGSAVESYRCWQMRRVHLAWKRYSNRSESTLPVDRSTNRSMIPLSRFCSTSQEKGTSRSRISSSSCWAPSRWRVESRSKSC